MRSTKDTIKRIQQQLIEASWATEAELKVQQAQAFTDHYLMHVSSNWISKSRLKSMPPLSRPRQIRLPMTASFGLISTPATIRISSDAKHSRRTWLLLMRHSSSLMALYAQPSK